MNTFLRKYFNDNSSVYNHIDHADIEFHTGTASQPNGYFIKLFLKVENNQIMDAKYNAFGCPFTIAVTSYFIEKIKNKTLLEASNIDNFDIKESLELPINKKDRLFLLEDAVKNCIKQINRGK